MIGDYLKKISLVRTLGRLSTHRLISVFHLASESVSHYLFYPIELLLFQVVLPSRPTVSLDDSSKHQLATLIDGVKVVGEGTEAIEAALATKRPLKVSTVGG